MSAYIDDCLALMKNKQSGAMAIRCDMRNYKVSREPQDVTHCRGTAANPLPSPGAQGCEETSV
eukprot:757722-Amphidinium_carterae.1